MATVRELGVASFRTDIPTREKIKAAAAANGMCVSDYLRVLADKAIEDIQGGLPQVSRLASSAPATKADIESLRAQGIENLFYLAKAVMMALGIPYDVKAEIYNSRHTRDLDGEMLAAIQKLPAIVREYMTKKSSQLKLEGDMPINEEG